MVIKGDVEYIKSLRSLWKNVFGDSDESIEIFFEKQYNRCETFIHLSDEKVASALYLLPCKLSYKENEYEGRYLFAAATDPVFRKKGIMAKLIEQAKEYCKEKEVDFIALLPASESLYGYYSKFGFHTAMHKYKGICSVDFINSLYGTADFATLKKFRDSLKCNRIIFDCGELDYIVSSMKSFGCSLVSDAVTCVVYNCEDKIAEELILSEEIKEEKFDTCSGECITVYSPYKKLFGAECEKIKFGMIYPVNSKLIGCDDIYMNLALD